MTLVMEKRATRWGTFEAVDLPAIGAGEFKLLLSYQQPAQLTWTCLVPQHTAPLPRGTFIRFWVAGALDPAGEEFSDENPLFEGYIEGIEPQTSSIGVSYTAYDPTWMATKKATIFSAAWPPGDPLADPPEPPLPPNNAIPRLIYNVKITADPDWSVQVGGEGTIGQVISGILEFCYHPLVWCDAAPGNGVDLELPYALDDVAAAYVRPQEKLDFQSESVRSAIERSQRYDPRLRLFWEPGSRLWRVRDLTTAPVRTLTLNQRDVEFPVLSLQLRPSTEQCITAIEIRGPETVLPEEFRWDEPANGTATSAGELEPLGEPIIYQTYGTVLGERQAKFWQQWQIVDPTKRRSARGFPAFYEYQRTPLIFGMTEQPLVLCSWDRGETWLEWYACWFDYLYGIITFSGSPPFFVMPSPPQSTQTFFCPNALKVIWGPFGAPLRVRRPATGYEGTAYTLAGLEVEEFQHDEALAIGREFGVPVTSEERRAAFEEYAQTLLDQRKDIVWTGGATLDGLDYAFSRLHRRVGFSVADGSGAALATDWNDIRAYVTDVEYDFEEQLTTLTFSADKLALFGIDAAQLREQLRIRPLTQSLEYRTALIFEQRPLPSGKVVQEAVGVSTTPVFHYTDESGA